MSSAAVQRTAPLYYPPPASERDRYAASPAAKLSSSPPSSRHTVSQSSGGMAASPQQFDTPSAPPTIYDSRSYAAKPQNPQQAQQPGGYSSDNDRDRTSDSERRRAHRSPRDDASPSGGNRSQRARHAPTASRSTTAVGQPPIDTSLPRENSAIINHIVVDDPQSDLARERARVAEARPHPPSGTDLTPMTGLGLVGEQGVPDTERAAQASAPQQPRSRQEHLRQGSSSQQQAGQRKEVKFGDYILGQTLGEGEFGKVKMGWKKDSTVQVAIKLIRKESLAGNATRLPKIYREIAILRELQHPNIVRLHEFVETERHMGIILEYASGGELFDYILNHRYLKDPAARRLFAQLVSGVGYLHRKGIVHRDLKLENLLLDRNKNIIITDFGFANTFNPGDELGEEVEGRITDKEFIKRSRLDAVGSDGHRRGDLMQTSCGSPCYAAPELVVSDGLYTGRKVDVWSCGVILYAMLAGYLPFDDDPANPEGDNINLLYKYIVNTALTFPEYVTPHARDLLRQILVPNPRRRADLFAVARHSWLSEYSHVVGFIGSAGKIPGERDVNAGEAALRLQEEGAKGLGRSASVREPPANRSPAALSGTSPASGTPRQPTAAYSSPLTTPAAAATGDEAGAAQGKTQQRDAKRRTVQLEYVAPLNATLRGSDPNSNIPSPSTTAANRSRTRADVSGPIEVAQLPARQVIPRKDVPTSAAMPPPTSTSRPGRDQYRATSEATGLAAQSQSRPNTSGTMGGSGPGGARLPSRGNSYSLPVAATPTTMNATGRFSQPGYGIGSGTEFTGGAESGRPGSQQNLAMFQQQQQTQQPQAIPQQDPKRTHKRSSTLSSLTDRMLGRSNSRRSQMAQDPQQQRQPQQTESEAEKKDRRRYPPISMKNAISNNNNFAAGNGGEEAQPRMSSESRRSSFNFLRKKSDAGLGGGVGVGVGEGRPTAERRGSRRFSGFAALLPNSLSMNGFGTSSVTRSKEAQPFYPDDGREAPGGGQSGRPVGMGNAGGVRGMAFGRGESRSPSASTTGSTIPLYYDADREAARQQRRAAGLPAGIEGRERWDKALPAQPSGQDPNSRKQFRDDGYGGNLLDRDPVAATQLDPEERFHTPQEPPPPSQLQEQQQRDPARLHSAPQQQQFANPALLADDGYEQSAAPTDNAGGEGGSSNNGGAGLRQPQRRFGDAPAYEQGHAGSSSGARRVMDFFRRRGRDRTTGQV